MPAAGKLEILIEIKSKLDEITAATTAMQTLREQTLAGVQGMQQAAQGMQTALQTGTAEAAKLKDGFKEAADQGADIAKKLGGVEKATGDMAALTAQTHEFNEQIRLGTGIGIGEHLVEGVREAIGELRAFVQEGVEFDKEVENLNLGIAGALKQAAPEKYISFEAARQDADRALEAIRAKTNELGLDFKSVGEGLKVNMLALVEGGVRDVNKQIEVMVLLMQAAASKGVQGFQATRDIIDILQGRAERVILSRELGITNEDIKRAQQMGQTYEYLISKLGAYKEAGQAASNSLTAIEQRLKNAEDRAKGVLAAPTFEAEKIGDANLAQALNSPQVVDNLRLVAAAVADVVKAGNGLKTWAVENGQALLVLAGAGTVMAGVFTANKLVGWITSLTQTTAVTRALTSATETGASSAAMATAHQLQLSATRAGIAAQNARDAAVQAAAELEVKGAVDAEAASYLRLELAAKTARADALAMTAVSEEAAAMRATNIASMGELLSAAVGPVLLIAAGLWAASAAADAADSKIKDMADRAEKTRRANLEELSGADTYQKILAVQAKMDEQVHQAQAEADRVHAANESLMGTVLSTIEVLTLRGDLEQKADEAAQEHVRALQQQLVDSGALAGIDTFRVKQAYELADKQRDAAHAGAEEKAAKEAQHQAELFNAQRIAAIRQELETGMRDGVTLTQTQLAYDRHTLDALREILNAHVGDAEAVRMINAAMADMVRLAQEANSASQKLAQTLASINFGKLSQAGQIADLGQQHAGQQKAFQDLVTKRENSTFGPQMDTGLIVDAARDFESMNRVIQQMPAGALKDQMTAVAVATHDIEEKSKSITGEIQKQADTARKYTEGTAEEVALLQLKTQMNQALARGDEQTASALASQVREAEMLKAYNDELTKSATAQGKAWADLGEQDKDNAWQAVQTRYQEKDAVQQVADAKKDQQERDRLAAEAARKATQAQREAERQAAAERKFADEQRENRVNLLRERVADIQADPTRSADEKSGELRAAIAAENAALADNIAYWRARNKELQNVGTREAMQEIEQNDHRITQAQKQQTQLSRQVGVNDFGGQFKQSYVHQIDQLGTAAQNAGHAFDTTLNSAIEGTSQALEAVIFKTGSWKQAMSSAVRSGINGLIELGVKTVAHYALLGVQMIAHKVLGTTLKTQDTAETVTQSATQAAALSPTAMLQSIVTYGVAAVIGVAAMLGAMALVGGFESGGYTGGVAGQMAGIVHGEEYVINAQATRALPRDFLDALNSQQVSVPGRGSRSAVGSGAVSAFAASADQYRQDAGNVSVGSPNVKVVNVTDAAAARREILQSAEFDHAFVHHMNRHGVSGRRT